MESIERKHPVFYERSLYTEKQLIRDTIPGVLIIPDEKPGRGDLSILINNQYITPANRIVLIFSKAYIRALDWLSITRFGKAEPLLYEIREIILGSFL